MGEYNTYEDNIYLYWLTEEFLIREKDTDRQCHWSYERLLEKKPTIEYTREEKNQPKKKFTIFKVNKDFLYCMIDFYMLAKNPIVDGNPEPDSEKNYLVIYKNGGVGYGVFDYEYHWNPSTKKLEHSREAFWFIEDDRLYVEDVLLYYIMSFPI